jgi:nucleoside-diphosphate-sugar epimerase
VLRFGLFYGPGSMHTEEALDMVRKGRSPVLGAPDAYQPSIHLHDAASAVVAALAVPSGTYNITDDEPLTKQEYGHAIASALGVADPKPFPKVLLKVLGKKVAPISRSQRVSNARFKAASGWAPAFPSAREGWAAVVSAEATSRG